MITAQGGITKWQRVRISSDGGMDAGKPTIAKGANYPGKKSLANIQDSKSVFRLLYGVASRKEKQGERINIYQV